MTQVIKVLNNYLSENGSVEKGGKFEAAANIKALLDRMDLHAELVPVKNHDMLTRLITSLKGKPLTKEEVDLIHEITT